ncbi:MAG: class I SAM-dependent methyltransferase [Deltaproteobacteria bacterium]|nr:class I SAM-dependent methyltransferase [Deltaproteobacteria bacterium]MBK8713114.1 class I SAM-dependent methyltransferase [Deltaproteobacteria bacterium]MBP7286692.1 class I SAM-dependent methyltransferase [Nannocystaceae bacterium]
MIVGVVREQLQSIGEELAVPLDDAALARLLTLRDLWLRYGRAMNLVGAHDEAALLPHFGDGIATIACAMRAGIVGPTTAWLDVGSGGGFPALIVAAASPCTVTMVEPRQKRASFLELALASTVDKGGVVRARTDDPTWRKKLAERHEYADESGFSVASSRAVFAPDRWLEVGDNLVMDRGVLLAHLHAGAGLGAKREILATVTWGESQIVAVRANSRR